MRDLLILAVHLLVTGAKLLRPGGVRPVAAESLLLKHQLQIAAIIEMKTHNPKCGYVRIAQQISHAFGITIDKDVVRRMRRNSSRKEF